MLLHIRRAKERRPAIGNLENIIALSMNSAGGFSVLKCSPVFCTFCMGAGNSSCNSGHITLSCEYNNRFIERSFTSDVCDPELNHRLCVAISFYSQEDSILAIFSTIFIFERHIRSIANL